MPWNSRISANSGRWSSWRPSSPSCSPQRMSRNLAVAMEPGSVAGVLVYENLWAAPFASAARRAGGQLIANGRIPTQAIIASLEADDSLDTTGA